MDKKISIEIAVKIVLLPYPQQLWITSKKENKVERERRYIRIFETADKIAKKSGYD